MNPRRALLFVALVVFFVNPGLGCGLDEAYEYDGTQMRAAIEGTWQVTLPAATGTTTYALTLTLAPGGVVVTGSRGVVRAAHACSSREFFRVAGACNDSSLMHLAGELTGNRDHAGEAVLGTYQILGRKLAPGRLELTLPDGRLLAAPGVDGQGATFAATVTGAAEGTVTATLLRQPR